MFSSSGIRLEKFGRIVVVYVGLGAPGDQTMFLLMSTEKLNIVVNFFYVTGARGGHGW